jgi:hypothetical protein
MPASSSQAGPSEHFLELRTRPPPADVILGLPNVRYVDALIEAIIQLKKDRTGTIAILEKYYQSNDDHAMGVAYDFYANEVVEPLPYPKPEQFKDAVAALSATNAKIADVDLSNVLDPSFVQNAADRGLGK